MIGTQDAVRLFFFGLLGLAAVAFLARAFRRASRRNIELPDLLARLKDRFPDARLERGRMELERIRLSFEGRPAEILRPGKDDLVLRPGPDDPPKFHMVLRTRRAFDWPVGGNWESMRFLRHIRTGHPEVDGAFAVYTTPDLRDRLPAEGLLALRGLPGVKSIEVRVSPRRGFRVGFLLRTDDLLRPDGMETALRAAFRLRDAQRQASAM